MGLLERVIGIIPSFFIIEDSSVMEIKLVHVLKNSRSSIALVGRKNKGDRYYI